MRNLLSTETPLINAVICVLREGGKEHGCCYVPSQPRPLKGPSMWHMGRCWNDVSLPRGQSWAGTHSSAHEKCTLWILTTCHDSNTDLDFLLDQLPLCGNQNYLLPPAVWQLPVKPSNGEVSSKKANILYNNATVVKWTHAKALNLITN